MQPDNYNPRSFLMLIRIIYFSMIAGLLFFLIFVLYMSNQNMFFSVDTDDPLTLLVLLTLVVIPAGFIYSGKMFRNYKPDSTLQDKLPVYQLGLITRMALCEGPGLFSVVCIFLTSNLYFLIFAFIALAAMITNYPSPEKIGEIMNLSPSEIESLKQ